MFSKWFSYYLPSHGKSFLSKTFISYFGLRVIHNIQLGLPSRVHLGAIYNIGSNEPKVLSEIS